MPDYPTWHALSVEFNRWISAHPILGEALILTVSVSSVAGWVLLIFRPVNKGQVLDIIREELKRHGQ